MAQFATALAAPLAGADDQPALSGEMRRHLGSTLRKVYEATLDTQPLPDAQVELLLQLRHRERDRRRVG